MLCIDCSIDNLAVWESCLPPRLACSCLQLFSRPWLAVLAQLNRHLKPTFETSIRAVALNVHAPQLLCRPRMAVPTQLPWLYLLSYLGCPFSVISSSVCMPRSCFAGLAWLYLLSYIKLAISIFKYIPQVSALAMRHSPTPVHATRCVCVSCAHAASSICHAPACLQCDYPQSDV